MAACNVAAGGTRCMAPRFHWWCSKVFFNIILAHKVAVSGKFNLIFRCDSLSSCSEKSDGRRAKEK